MGDDWSLRSCELADLVTLRPMCWLMMDLPHLPWGFGSPHIYLLRVTYVAMGGERDVWASLSQSPPDQSQDSVGQPGLVRPTGGGFDFP